MIQVTMGSLISCSFGTVPTPLVVLPEGPVVMGDGMLAATIMDFMPMVNIPTFAICHSPMNPACIPPMILTGVPIGPCIPITVAPWAPGVPTILIGGIPTLDNASMTMCAYAGVIQVETPLAMNIQVG